MNRLTAVIAALALAPAALAQESQPQAAPPQPAAPEAAPKQTSGDTVDAAALQGKVAAAEATLA